MMCEIGATTFWESIRVIAPLSFVINYVVIISSVLLFLFIFKNSKRTVLGSLSASVIVLTGLSVALHFIMPYFGIEYGIKIAPLSVVLIMLASLLLYFFNHHLILRNIPGKHLVLASSSLFLLISVYILFGSQILGTVPGSCFAPIWGSGMYAVYGFMILIACAHIYLFLYAYTRKMITSIFSNELLSTIISILMLGFVWYVGIHNPVFFNQYLLLGVYITLIGLAYITLADRKSGSGLISSSILIPLLVIVLTSFILIDDLALVKQMVIIAGALALTVGYVLDSFLHKQLEYEIILTSQNNQLKQLNESKNEFLSFATHQLKAPLTSLKWGIDAMRDEQLSSNQDMIANQLLITTNQMVRTVSDFLNSSKLESGQLELIKSKMYIAVLVQKVLNEFYPIAASKNLILTGKFPKNRVIAEVDDLKLEQVISNLIDNAIKYTQNGTIVVAVTDNNNKVQISVTDTGVGMDEGESDRLFQKYQRGSASVLNSAGSGIGLYLGREIVKMHGGTMTAQSPGKGMGTLFTIELPLY